MCKYNYKYININYIMFFFIIVLVIYIISLIFSKRIRQININEIFRPVKFI